MKAMAALGLFVFHLRTAPYQQLAQSRAWRHPSQSRVGLRPAYQYLGKDAESISLSGRLATELTGGTPHLALLSLQADTGKAWPLIRGDGLYFGMFVIESMNQTYSELFDNGTARLIDFDLALKRVDESLIDSLGEITDAMLDLL